MTRASSWLWLLLRDGGAVKWEREHGEREDLRTMHDMGAMGWAAGGQPRQCPKVEAYPPVSLAGSGILASAVDEQRWWLRVRAWEKPTCLLCFGFGRTRAFGDGEATFLC